MHHQGPAVGSEPLLLSAWYWLLVESFVNCESIVNQCVRVPDADFVDVLGNE